MRRASTSSTSSRNSSSRNSGTNPSLAYHVKMYFPPFYVMYYPSPFLKQSSLSSEKE